MIDTTTKNMETSFFSAGNNSIIDGREASKECTDAMEELVAIEQNGKDVTTCSFIVFEYCHLFSKECFIKFFLKSRFSKLVDCIIKVQSQINQLNDD